MLCCHTIPPVFDERSAVLVLGSFPSVKSREGRFFYHHPQNRFWKVLAGILKLPEPGTIEEKRTMLLNNRIALWDVIKSCEIKGSADSSIEAVVPNDLSAILKHSSVSRVFTNGGTAHSLYRKYCREQTGIEAIRLPSTSPANAGYSLDRLVSEWSVLNNYLN